MTRKRQLGLVYLRFAVTAITIALIVFTSTWMLRAPSQSDDEGPVNYDGKASMLVLEASDAIGAKMWLGNELVTVEDVVWGVYPDGLMTIAAFHCCIPWCAA